MPHDKTLYRCTRQTGLESQALVCTNLAHQELEGFAILIILRACLLGWLEGRGSVAAVHAAISNTHGGSALILLRVALLAHAEWLHCEPILLYLHSASHQLPILTMTRSYTVISSCVQGAKRCSGSGVGSGRPVCSSASLCGF